jgi:hypothetical protein
VAAIEGGRVEFDGGATGRDRPFGAALTVPDQDLVAWHASQPYERGSITDDAPFFWHFVRFRDALRNMQGNVEEGFGERVLLLFLGVATLLAAVFLLAPLVTLRRVWREIPYKANTFVYFAALGVGFMLIEVSLIQRLTLFLGYPTHSLTVTLFALLISTGVGSLLTDRLAASWKRVLPVYVAVLVLLVAFALAFLTPTLGALGLALPARRDRDRPPGSVMLLPDSLLRLALWMLSHSIYRIRVEGRDNIPEQGGALFVANHMSWVDAVLLIALGIYWIGIAALLRTPQPA